jgi:hypothetical protein
MYYILITLLLILIIYSCYSSRENFNIETEKRGMIRHTYLGDYEGDLGFFDKKKEVYSKIIREVSVNEDVKNISYFYETEYVPTKSGNYSFKLISKGPSYLYINDVKVVDNGGIHTLKEKSGDIYLIGGEIYRIKLYYGNNIGKSFLKFLWKRPSDYFFTESLSDFLPRKTNPIETKGL